MDRETKPNFIITPSEVDLTVKSTFYDMHSAFRALENYTDEEVVLWARSTGTAYNPMDWEATLRDNVVHIKGSEVPFESFIYPNLH